MKVKVALSVGDPNGIGPEVILRSFMRSPLFQECVPVLFGPHDVLSYYAKHLGIPDLLHPVSDPSEAREDLLNVVSLSDDSFLPGAIGIPTEISGAISLNAIDAAVNACLTGSLDALVTAPISKEAIAKAGSPFKGHTDLLAAKTGAGQVIMILSCTSMKVGLVTVHLPLKEVAARITRENVLRTIRSAHNALIHDYHVEQPLLAVLSLNPHAGDGGVIGEEEEESILPAVRDALAEGIRARGPFPADAFFSAHRTQFYDIIIAMYHDQGLIPLKMQARGRGVNVTSGLSFVRTSPDHGTAYDIAGKLVAKPDSMREAILHAVFLARNRKKRTVAVSE